MAWPRITGALLGLYALVGGVLSFTGWVFNLPRLTDWYNNGISIQPNTCIAVMAAGAGLIFLTFGYQRVAACLGVVVALIGGTVVFQYLTGINLGIDALLLFDRTWGRLGVVTPGRMGPPGSLSWTIIGFTLFLTSISGTPQAPGPAFQVRPLIPVLALLTTALSTLSIIGYIYGASVLYTVPTLTVIALQTATFILAISLGLLTTVTERGPMRLINDDSPAGLITRRVVPAIIALPVLVGFIRLTGERAGLYDTAFGSALRTVIEIGLFLLLMGWTGNAISRQARRLEVQRAELLEREHELRTVAEASSKLKDEFLATLSHELRNPLNVVLGYSELLLRTPQIADTPHLLQIIQALKRNAQSQSQLINDLLDLSRLQMGKVALNREIVSLGTILENAVETVRAEATAKNITISVTSPDEIFVVNADPLRMQQVVWNLLNNAVKFTPDGGAISLSLQSENGAVLLAIEDSGPGIDPEFLPHVFEMFRQADSSSVRRHGGMGIGLALVHQLIQLHEGSISVTSAGPGHGAKFTIRLPACQQKDLSEAITSNPTLELTDMGVLVIDDSADTTEMLRQLLEINGAKVRTASSGAEALRVVNQQKFDVIISDVSMPEMDGFEFLRQLRDQPEHRDVPVLALTGFGRPEDIERAKSAGFVSHITKPFDLEKLAETLRTVSNTRRKEY
jgi:signal transduction histidine kinase/ActR/RegA family two-component response regulator